MKNTGSFDCVRLAFPRMRMRAPSPVRPEGVIAVRPGSRACRRLDEIADRRILRRLNHGDGVAESFDFRLLAGSGDDDLLELQRGDLQLDVGARGLSGSHDKRACGRGVADQTNANLDLSRRNAGDAIDTGFVGRTSELGTGDEHLRTSERSAGSGIGDRAFDVAGLNLCRDRSRCTGRDDESERRRERQKQTGHAQLH